MTSSGAGKQTQQPLFTVIITRNNSPSVSLLASFSSDLLMQNMHVFLFFQFVNYTNPASISCTSITDILAPVVIVAKVAFLKYHFAPIAPNGSAVYGK